MNPEPDKTEEQHSAQEALAQAVACSMPVNGLFGLPC
jgi:hypothetical protein